jgi:hypothetical protein
MSIHELLKIPMDQRDLNWEYKFFDLFALTKLKILSPDPQQGPDGWPYLLTEISETATDHAQQVINWLATRGIGLVVNPQGAYPDYIFNYGMLWHFKEKNLFVQIQEKVHEAGPIILPANTKLQAGPPSPTYLPQYVRSIIKDFFRDQGLFGIKIIVMSQDKKHYDLCFSLESLGNPPANEHNGIAEALSWFLPQHYSLVLLSEKGLPQFTPL